MFKCDQEVLQRARPGGCQSKILNFLLDFLLMQFSLDSMLVGLQEFAVESLCITVSFIFTDKFHGLGCFQTTLKNTVSKFCCCLNNSFSAADESTYVEGRIFSMPCVAARDLKCRCHTIHLLSSINSLCCVTSRS